MTFSVLQAFGSAPFYLSLLAKTGGIHIARSGHLQVAFSPFDTPFRQIKVVKGSMQMNQFGFAGGTLFFTLFVTRELQ